MLTPIDFHIRDFQPGDSAAPGLYGRTGFAFDRNIPGRHDVLYVVYGLAL
jgi:hypothetical protein